MNFIFSILLFFTCGEISAQIFSNTLFNPEQSKLILQQWTAENGLPADEIYSIIKSRSGLLWIGSSDGISSFDGLTFTNFNSENTPEIKGRNVTRIHEDSNGSLWFTNGNMGLVKFQDKKFTRFTIKDGLPTNSISSICEVPGKGLWFGTRGGGVANYHQGKFTLLNLKNGLNDNRVTELCSDEAGNLWIGTNGNGINILMNDSIKYLKTENDLPSNRISFLFTDNTNKIWIGTENGIACVENERITFTSLKGMRINKIAQDSSGVVYAAAGTSIYYFDEHTAVKINNEALKLTGNILEMYFSGSQKLWIGSAGDGLVLIKKSTVDVITEKNGLPDSYIRAVFDDKDGMLWLGLEQGLAAYNCNQNKIAFIDSRFKNILVCSINKNTAGKMVIGTRNNGAFIIDDNSLKNYNIKNGLTRNFIRSIWVDEDSSIWFGTNGGGINILKNNRFTYFNTKNGLSNDFISVLFKDNEGNMWVGTTGGGITVIGKSGKIIYYNESNGLSHDAVTSIYQGSHGDIWVSMNSGGISRIRDGVVKNIVKQNGLFENRVIKLIEDGNETIWCTTNNGVFRVSKKNLNNFIDGKIKQINYQVIGKADGMLNEECMGVSSDVGCFAGGFVFVPTGNGLVKIDPDKIKSEQKNIPVMILKILIDSKEVDPTKLISLSPDVENIEIHYTAVSFENAENLTFKFRLDGINKDWTNAGKRRTAYYTHLPAGSYSFYVKAATSNGTETIIGAPLNFTIEPYFWMRTWFQILAAALFLSIVLLTQKYISTKRFKRKLELVEAHHALEKERMRISRNMHDELGTSLTKINLLSELARKNKNNKPELENYLNKISEAGREVTLTMDEIVWAINPKNDNLENLIGYIIDFAENYLSLAGINFSVEIPDMIDTKFIHAEYRHNIFLVIKESFNNVVKHSGADKVRIQFLKDDNSIKIIIEDNGKGIQLDAAEKFSNGLINMKKRMEEIGGSFDICSTGKGTKINISVSVE